MLHIPICYNRFFQRVHAYIINFQLIYLYYIIPTRIIKLNVELPIIN